MIANLIPGSAGHSHKMITWRWYISDSVKLDAWLGLVVPGTVHMTNLVAVVGTMDGSSYAQLKATVIICYRK